MRDADALARLEADGLVLRDERGARTTARWQAAMARAAARLYRSGAPWRDLRLPIVAALIELYGDVSDEEIASFVEVLLLIEAAAIPAPASEGGARDT